MRKLYIYCLFILSIPFFTGCDFLDIVPDEKATEKDAFEDQTALDRFLYSCYSYLPTPHHSTGSLDLLTGDEVVTAFEHETFAGFPKGNYTASQPVISYWNSFFQGLRQCYILLNNVDAVPGISDSLKKDYIAQAKFLIAYYHFLLARCYGPIILIKEEPALTTTADDYLGRTPYDECIEFICDLFDEAAQDLPTSRPVREYGLATSVAAKSLKAKMLMYAASPLFNGNSEFYANFRNKDGELLMPVTYDAGKWTKAKTAFEEAIRLAEQTGHALYMTTNYNNGNVEPVDPIQHRLRYNILEAGNSEIIWGDAREPDHEHKGQYGLQNKSLPYSSASAWNGIAPTLAMVKRFYTKNGLPIEEDPEFNTSTMYNVVEVTADYKDVADVGSKTVRLNLDREPRFYAWVAFQGGFYEILSAQSKGAYNADASYQKYTTENGGKLVCDFVLGGNCSRGESKANMRTSNYSPTGYLNKKGVEPAFAVSTDLQNPIAAPWPIIRLADLYLGYAEACVEVNDLSTAMTYLNYVRNRAGIPNVQTSWNGITTLDQAKLREIVRQERMIEFYLENQNFWDLRRWKMAGQYFDKKAQGMTIDAESIEEFAHVSEVIFERKFVSPTQYLMPIPLSDVNKNEKLVQNPGY